MLNVNNQRENGYVVVDLNVTVLSGDNTLKTKNNNSAFK